MTINSGTVATNVNGPNGSNYSGGSGTITLAGTSLLTINDVTHNSQINPISVSNGVSATITAGVGGAFNANIDSPITLNTGSNLTIGTNAGIGTFTLFIGGGSTGPGNLIISSSAGTGNIVFNGSTAFNNSGTITNSGTVNGSSTSVQEAIGASAGQVIQNSTASSLALTVASAFTNGLLIDAGAVNGTVANAFGANTSVITIGQSGVNANNATLTSGFAGTFANPITVAAGSSGLLSITDTATTTTFSGPVTMNNTLTIAPAANNIVFSGGFTTGSGTTNLMIQAGTTGTGTTTIQTGAVNISGSITNSGVGAGLTTIKRGHRARTSPASPRTARRR